MKFTPASIALRMAASPERLLASSPGVFAAARIGPRQITETSRSVPPSLRYFMSFSFPLSERQQDLPGPQHVH